MKLTIKVITFVMMALSVFTSSAKTLDANVINTNALRGCEFIGDYQAGDGHVYTFDCGDTYVNLIMYDDGVMEIELMR